MLARLAALVVLGLVSLRAAADAPALRPEDEAAIRAHFSAFDAAFARADARGVAEGYAEDADILRPNQPAVVGRAAIEAFYLEMFAGAMKDVRKGGTVDRIRVVAPALAVVDSSYTLDRDAPPLHARGVSLTVLEKRAGRWVAILSRSYRIPDTGGATPKP
ncbi:MAG TPA: SgcJ/EcaC family oxidoreductase [Vicinamibacteria bacterium]|nr:SgcJ/EcaC family oxidoreductase [Vicinamibacteria bacterium]